MDQAGVSEKISQNTWLLRVDLQKNKARAFIRSEYYGEFGFDVALAREKGTADHEIKPIKKRSLSWISSGSRKYSKGHMVNGMPDLKIIENTIMEGKAIIQNEYENNLKRWISYQIMR